MQSQPGSAMGGSSGSRGLLDGLMPAIWALVAMLVGIALTIGARFITAPQGYDLERTVVFPLLAVTVVIAAALYVVACVRALRRVRAAEGSADQAGARAMLWGLVLTAIVVVIPVIVSTLFPQHPAP